MNLPITPEQKRWLESQVAAGSYPSLEHAVRAAIDEAMAERAHIDASDFAWAKADVEAARAEATRGDVLTLDEHRARMAARLRDLKR